MGPILRTSCDTCNLAKVKCTKEQPQCQRCSKHRINCVYGISLRAGKRSAQNVIFHSKRVKSPPSPPTDYIIDFSAETIPYSPPPLGMETYPSTFNFDVPFPLENFEANGTFLSSYDAFQSLPDLAFSDLPNISSVSMTPKALPVISDSMLPFSTPIVHPGIQSPHTPASLPCSCFGTVTLRLSTLKQLSESSLTGFEMALVHNKEAVALCISTFKCRCASDSTIVLLVSSLLSLVIDIYQGLRRTWKTLEHREQSQDKMITARLTRGVYDVDKSNEERRKTEIVRMELRGVVS
jgi:hypothetical protein